MCQGRPRSAFRIDGELTSRVAWLDNDDKQRKAMLEIVDLFREKDTVDDLGYGIVQDAISDTLFPGVSVLHTRPRYMLLISWIYSGLLDDGISGQRAIVRGRNLELGLSQTLLEAGETQGVIGRVAGKSLKRLPSAEYWAAIRKYGLLGVNSSLETYCRSIPVLRQPRQFSKRFSACSRVRGWRSTREMLPGIGHTPIPVCRPFVATCRQFLAEFLGNLKQY